MNETETKENDFAYTSVGCVHGRFVPSDENPAKGYLHLVNGSRTNRVPKAKTSNRILHPVKKADKPIAVTLNHKLIYWADRNNIDLNEDKFYLVWIHFRDRQLHLELIAAHDQEVSVGMRSGSGIITGQVAIQSKQGVIVKIERNVPLSPRHKKAWRFIPFTVSLNFPTMSPFDMVGQIWRFKVEIRPTGLLMNDCECIRSERTKVILPGKQKDKKKTPALILPKSNRAISA